jgi:hypothetical protein
MLEEEGKVNLTLLRTVSRRASSHSPGRAPGTNLTSYDIKFIDSINCHQAESTEGDPG